VVTLKVYDMLGREVKNLVNEPMQPGQYSAQWDGTNNHDEPVPSGIYIYRLVAGKFTAINKMSLVK
jgi:flagellar hook assembly protein FlgD